MRQIFTRQFMMDNCGCYSVDKLTDCSFMNGKEITIRSIIESEIPLKDKYWFVCKKLATKEQNKQIAISVAEIVLPIFEKRYPDDKRPREAIEAAKQFISGHISLEELIDKIHAADAYADAAAADAYAAATAADAYADAAAADAYAAADAADADAYAAATAAYAAADAAYADAAAAYAYAAAAAYATADTTAAAYAYAAAAAAAAYADAAAAAYADAEIKQQLLNYLLTFCK